MLENIINETTVILFNDVLDMIVFPALIYYWILPEVASKCGWGFDSLLSLKAHKVMITSLLKHSLSILTVAWVSFFRRLGQEGIFRSSFSTPLKIKWMPELDWVDNILPFDLLSHLGLYTSWAQLIFFWSLFWYIVVVKYLLQETLESRCYYLDENVFFLIPLILIAICLGDFIFNTPPESPYFLLQKNVYICELYRYPNEIQLINLVETVSRQVGFFCRASDLYSNPEQHIKMLISDPSLKSSLDYAELFSKDIKAYRAGFWKPLY